MALRRLSIALLTATALVSVGASEAQAAPVGLFLAGIGAGLSGAGVLGGSLAIGGALGAGTAVGAFLAAHAGTLLLAAVTIGISLALQAGRPQVESSVNVRLPAGIRWHAAGVRKLGGTVVFGAFDADGAFWSIIVHGDSELVDLGHYEFDNIALTVDGSNRVTTDEFKAWAGGVLGQFQVLTPFFSLWTSTHDPEDPVPPAPPAAFLSAFPEWTSDHKLTGTTFTVMKIDPVDDKQRAQIYKWQGGAYRLGEPGLSIVGTWSRVYDPRDTEQEVDDETTWGASTNAALIWAWNRYRRHGFGDDISSALNWSLIAAAADICDEIIEDKYGAEWPRYGCGVAISEDMTNAQAEQEILLACDGIVLTDSDGKLYVKVGAWEEPAVEITEARDILSMSSREIEDGEMETDGVVVTYTDPDLGYVPTPSAPWRNPNYYVDGEAPNYLNVKIEGCPSHNQAVRLAKAIGMRSQASVRLAPTVGLRVQRLRQERIIGLDYEGFSGDYLIHAPVELDASYRGGVLGLVPVNENNWILLEGEEGDKPRRDVVDNDDTIPLLDPGDVVLTAVPVAGTNGNSVRIEATFPEPPSVIYNYQFDYSPDDGVSWRPMSVSLTALAAVSESVDADGSYLVRWRTTTSGGNYSDYNDPPAEVTALAFYSLNFAVLANSQYLGAI
jgi:hypothetical protein